jgi:hypothetical protein
VEVAAVRFLQKKPDCTLRDLETALNAEFSGFQTPSLGMIRAMLDSYADETDGHWTLRTEDFPAARRADLEMAAQFLINLGSRLGYSLQCEESPQRVVHWQESGQTVYTFHLIASAVVGRLLRQNPSPPHNTFLVLPGGRSGLLNYKLDRDPGLRSIAERWRVIKLRQLRHLVEMTALTRERFEKELSGDPIEPPEQMQLF